MFSLIAANHTRRINRRQLLGLGTLGAAGLSLPRLLRAEHGAGQRGARGKAKNCIYIFLCGGPSHLDLWDLKPDAPEGIRGSFSPIATSAPGVQIGELLPHVAQHGDKLAIIRSMTHGDNGHQGGIVHTLLGHKPPPADGFYIARGDHPGCGAVLHRLFGSRGELPPWVILPRPFTTGSPPYKGQSGGFLGAAYDPFMLDKEKKDSLAATDLKVGALKLPEGLTESRLTTRKRLLGSLEQSAAAASDQGRQLGEYYDKAFAMLSSGTANTAFDVTREPEGVRDRYGRNEYGQSFLLARRLVEAGVRVVNVFWTFFDEKGCQFNLWDNHGLEKDFCGSGGAYKGLAMLKHEYCTPSFDRAFSALLDDLHQRGLLDETLVCVTGEFGRTPRVNKNTGRDHWAHCYSQLLAGGGVRGGQTYGASDSQGAYVKDLPVTPDDFTATLYHAFGITPATVVYDPLHRPVRVSTGRPVTAVF